MSDLALDQKLQKGSKGKAVRLAQEWLSLHGFQLAIDGDFGPATQAAVTGFQKKNGVTANGAVGQATFAKLIEPMVRAMGEATLPRGSLGRQVVAYAQQHLHQHPMEIGGQNRGPWVRLYMKGNEGAAWPWCAGFVSYVLQQACRTLGTPVPITTSFSCDSLAASARGNDIFLRESEVRSGSRVTPGSIFLSRRTQDDWTHTGFVIKAGGDVFETIEGNTNDEGSREGYEVCRRFRGFKDKDFIVI